MVTESRPVERVPLDKLIERAEQAAESSGAAGEAEEFAVLLRVKGPGTRMGDRSMLADLMQFIMPTVTDASIFQTGRCIQILEHLVQEIIPNLDESEELRRLATTMLTEEIERQRDLQTRRHGAIAA